MEDNSVYGMETAEVYDLLQPSDTYGEFISPRVASLNSMDSSRASSELILSDSEEENAVTGVGHVLSWNEKVHVIKTRSLVNARAADVLKQRDAVQNSSQELSKYRDQLSSIQQQKQQLHVELHQAAVDANIALVDRLQAAIKKLSIEQETVEEQIEMLTQMLSSDQKELSKAELEHGRVSAQQLETKLVEDEMTWAAERDNEARMRHFKEERYASNAARSQRLQHQMTVEKANERNLLEKARHDEMLASQNRHQKFLLQSNARAQAVEEENRLQEHIRRENQINSVLTLKRDIDANRENMRALQIRNTMRQKQTEAEKLQREQELASTAGQIAVIKERRQNKFDQLRQESQAVQMKRHVDIVEKIVAEERLLAVRQQRQPYLYVDRHKESLKKVEQQPHHRRRPKGSKILKAMQKSEPVPVDPGIDYSKYQDMSDSDSSDDESFAEQSVPDNKAIQHDMDQPEFAGLWDPTTRQQQQPSILTSIGLKQRTVRSKMEELSMPIRSRIVPLNSVELLNRIIEKPLVEDNLRGSQEQARTILPKLLSAALRKNLEIVRVSDEDIMQRQLTKLRESRIVKQVAAGREFKGSPFTARPEIIHFKDFDIGSTYDKKVQLTNVSHTLTYCKLVGISEQLKDFVFIKFDPPGQLSAGMTCWLHVTFKPMLNRDLEGEVSFLAQTGPFCIPIKCTMKKCDLRVDNQVVDFGTAVIGETIRKAVVLTNHGALATSFQFCRSSGFKPSQNAESSAISALAPVVGSVLEDTSVLVSGVVVPPSKVASPSLMEEGNANVVASTSANNNNESNTVTEPGANVPEGIISTQSAAAIDSGNSTSLVVHASQLEDSTLIVDEMYPGQVTAGEIGPHSSVKLEIVWKPTIPGRMSAEFLVTFADSQLSEIVVKAMANAIDIPVWVEKSNVDLKICMYDRLYQDTFVIHNRATTAMKLRFEVPKELRGHLEILPHTGFIQAQSSFSAQLKFLPRLSLSEDAKEYFDTATGIFDASMKIIIDKQTRPVQFSVNAVVTTSDLLFNVTEVNFGCCTIYEATTHTIELTNCSVLPQQFGFVGIPEYVDIQPGDGFGTILPRETIQLDVIFQPQRARNYQFELTCKTLINREFKLKCTGVGVHPPLELSHQVVNFAPTSLNDMSVASIVISNSHCDKQEYRHPVPRIGAGDIASVGPTSFEFVVPEGSPLVVSPSVGTLEPGSKCKITVQFKPVLSDADIRHEAARLIARELERKAEELRKLQVEREAQEQLAQEQKTRKGSPSRTKMKSTKSGDSQSPTNFQSPLPVEPPTPENIVRNSAEYWAGHSSLLRQFSSQLASYVIPCYIASGPTRIDPASTPEYSVHNTLCVNVHCPTIRPDIVVISNSSDTTVDFSDVAVGQRVVKSVTIQNISDSPVELHSSCLATEGPFTVLNAWRVVPPDGLHTLKISFLPSRVQTFRETLRIDCCSSALSLTLKGVGVSPVLTLSVTDALMDFGYLLAGDYKEQAFTITNTSSLSVEYQLRLASERLHLSRTSGSPTDSNSNSTPMIGTQNYSGQQVFNCTPSKGVIEPGSAKEIVVTFSPDHHSQCFFDVCYVDLFGQKDTNMFQLKGSACDHYMYVRGGDQLTSQTESLSAVSKLVRDDEDYAIPVLITLHSTASETGFSTSTREVLVGCVKPLTAPISKKGAGAGGKQAASGKQSVEWSFDNIQQLASLGFSIDPLKGVVDAGAEKVVTVTWSPPAGGLNVSTSVNCQVKGDVTQSYQFLLRGFINRD